VSNPRRRRRRSRKKVPAPYQGCDSIPKLYAWLVRRSAPKIDTGELAKLLQLPVGDFVSLAWLPGATLAKVRKVFADWSSADIRDRYRLRQTHRDTLDDLLGSRWFERPTVALEVAFLLGHEFTRVSVDLARIAPWETFRAAGVLATARSFLDEISNTPPPLGQMTTMAAVRRWSGGFWYVGHPSESDVFGPSPRPRRIELPARVELALSNARDDDELRIAAVSWRGHDVNKDFVRAPSARPGTFAITGLQSPFPENEFAQVLDVLTEHEAHVAVMPELMVSLAELDHVKSMLQERGRRWPVLLVVGLAHHTRAGGFANVAVALDSGGREVMRHEKLEPFSMTLPSGASSPEDIVPRESNTYDFADTPVGRFAINVCRDIRSDVPMLMNRSLGITLLAVPTYSERLDFVAEEARVLGSRQHALTVAVNPPRFDKPKSADPNDPDSYRAAYVYVPIKGKNAGQRWVPGPHATAQVHVWRISRQGRVGQLATVADVTV
jgi:hypothetical protein